MWLNQSNSHVKGISTMSISKSYNKNNGVTCVYDVYQNYWDKDLKKQVTRRRCLDKIDPKTGEFIPSKKKKEADQKPEPSSKKPAALSRTADDHQIVFLQELSASLESQINDLNSVILSLTAQKEKVQSRLKSLLESNQS